MCNPVLTFGLDTIAVSKRNMVELESTQGTMVKRFLGIGKRSHHSPLLRALDIPRISDSITLKTLSLFNRSFKVESPLLSLHARMLADYIVHGHRSKGSTIDRIIECGFSPIDIAFSDSTSFRSRVAGDDPIAGATLRGLGDGVVDSLKYLVFHENFIKPWADEHVLAVLLTRCFWSGSRNMFVAPSYCVHIITPTSRLSPKWCIFWVFTDSFDMLSPCDWPIIFAF